ncbi:amidohydrolase family protein [Streptomyces sp. NPDC048337]|uniref:amidohydrolase family protein n=1 Tax=Streptomyces sp. NPDC048337 TaxID=3365535 RepID=UPI003721004F
MSDAEGGRGHAGRQGDGAGRIHSARRDPHGPGQALTALEALQGMTVNAAWAAGEEDRAGRLAVGHRADLTAFAENPLTTAPTDLPALPVRLTVLDGDTTHRDPSL